MTLSIELHGLQQDAALLADLPAKPAMYCFEDENRGTLLLATTSNLRRSAAEKLQIGNPSPLARRFNYSGLTRRLSAVPVGSQFEADWAYLQWARRLLSQSYRGMLDRWQAWFVHCDSQATHPQLTKTAHPDPTRPGTHVGPFADKHAAARYIELLQNVFDLCRYHHLLVQAPSASACAYKEMGRCPAPCDGSIALEAYRRQTQDAIDFACQRFPQWQAQIEQSMEQASQSLDFEHAQRCRDLLNRAAPAAKGEFAWVDRLERFELLCFMHSSATSWVRMFLIKGGWIAPVLDFDKHITFEVLAELIKPIIDSEIPASLKWCDASIENIGLVCWHLFRPQRAKCGSFLRLDEAQDVAALRAVLRKLEKSSNTGDPAIADQDLSTI